MKNLFNVRREPLILLVSIGLAIGMLITGLAWLFPLPTKGLFTQAAWFWVLTLAGTALTLSGARLDQEQHYPAVPKPVLLLAVFAATALVYLFPELFAPGCGDMPRAFAACPAACRITTCSDWAAPGERGCNAKPPDKGCCFAYTTTCDPSCTEPDPTPVPTNQPPVISGAANCAVPGSAGWCKGGGVLNLSASDPQGFSITIAGDIAGIPFTCAGPNCSQALPAGSGAIHFQASAPSSGLSSAAGSASFAFDPLPPSASLTISGTAGTAGWYKSAVVSTTGSDTTSGLAASQVSVDGGAWQAAVTLAEGTHIVLGRATDNAGNMTVTLAKTVKVDATAPNISASVVSGGLAGSWYASNVIVKASGSDDTSGLALVETRMDGGAWIPGDQLTVESDGIHSLEFSAVDNAGNSGSTSMVIRKDVTPPDLSIPSIPDGLNGWYVTLPTLSLAANDATSGLNSALFSNGQPTMAIKANGVYNLSATALDNAGNSTSTVATIRVDTDPPVLTVSSPIPDGRNDWFVTAPTFSLTASDATSGLASALFGNGQTTMTIPGDGIYNIYATAKDNAGNTVSYVSSVRKDSTPPTLSIPNAPDGSNGWYVTLPTLSLAANDSLSGLESALFSNGKPTYTIAAQGASSVSAQAVDYAGNATSVTATVSVDNVPPALGVSAPAVDGSNGWYISSPTFSLVASDATSGLASALFSDGKASQTIITDGIHDLSATAADKAGNIAPLALIVKKDAAPPNLGIPADPDGKNGWYITKPTLTLTASDATSGLASALFSNGKSTTAITADGIYPLKATAVDIAGNTTQANKVIQVDTTPPTLFIPSLPDGLNGWYVTFPTLSLLSSDATSGLSSALFSNGRPTTLINSDGVYTLSASAADRAGNSSSANQTVQVDTTAPDLSFSIPYPPDGQNGWYTTKPSLTLTASDATSGLTSAVFADGGSSFSTKDGAQVISATAKDRAGNTQTISQTIKVDTTPPTLTPFLLGTGANGWYNETVTISLNGQDTISGIGRTEYRLDGGDWHTGSGLSVSTEGEHRLEMRITDNAGNITTASHSFKLDTTKPISAFTNPTNGTQIKVAGIVSLTGFSKDNLSGLSSAGISLDGGITWLPLIATAGNWYYSWDTTRIPDGTYNIQVYTEDMAGNRENFARVQVIVGNKPPKVEIQSEWWLWESGYLKIQPRQIPIREVTLRIACAPFHPDVVLKFSGDHFPSDLKWDRLCGNGAYAAESRDYTVTLNACDTFGHCAEDTGVIKVPFIAPVMPTWTPTAEPSPTSVSTAHPSPTMQVSITEVPAPGAASTSAQITKQPRPNGLTWTLAFLLTALLALASAAALDPRPQALRKVGNTLAKLMQAASRPDEQA